MTLQDLLTASAALGHLPEVEVITPPKNATSNRGKVTTISYDGRYKGCAVRFPGLDYDTWFSDSNDTDKRSRYMYQLKIAPWKKV